MKCKQCGACCIAMSITSQIPLMPNGKPSGVRCIHLTEDRKCRLFGDPRRPKVCREYQPDPEICIGDFAETMSNIYHLEAMTSPHYNFAITTGGDSE